MVFTIDKFFIEEFNKTYGTSLTYADFKEFYFSTRQKKKDQGLVKDVSYRPSRRVDHWDIKDFSSFE